MQNFIFLGPKPTLSSSRSQRSPLFKVNRFDIIQQVLILKKFYRRMSKKAERQIRKRISQTENIDEIVRLCLDGIQINSITSSVKKLLETLVNLEYLTLNSCSLKNLDNFPHLPSLNALELSENQLKGDDLDKLGRAPMIAFLTLDKNNISNRNNIHLLNCLPDLQILQIHDNPLTNSYDYRELIFNTLPNVKAVGCKDRQGNLVDEEEMSEYISFRSVRSHPNFDDFGVNNQNQWANNIETVHSREDNILKRQSLNTIGVSVYLVQQNPRKVPTDIMSMRSTSKQDEEQENEKPLLRDFIKKMFKKE